MEGKASYRPRERASKEVYSSKLAPPWDQRHDCQAGPVQQLKTNPQALSMLSNIPTQDPFFSSH
eukprot:1146010-Pelagomonas_calceolata.AAC.4